MEKAKSNLSKIDEQVGLRTQGRAYLGVCDYADGGFGRRFEIGESLYSSYTFQVGFFLNTGRMIRSYSEVISWVSHRMNRRNGDITSQIPLQDLSEIRIEYNRNKTHNNRIIPWSQTCSGPSTHQLRRNQGTRRTAIGQREQTYFVGWVVLGGS